MADAVTVKVVGLHAEFAPWPLQSTSELRGRVGGATVRRTIPVPQTVQPSVQLLPPLWRRWHLCNLLLLAWSLAGAAVQRWGEEERAVLLRAGWKAGTPALPSAAAEQAHCVRESPQSSDPCCECVWWGMSRSVAQSWPGPAPRRPLLPPPPPPLLPPGLAAGGGAVLLPLHGALC